MDYPACSLFAAAKVTVDNRKDLNLVVEDDVDDADLEAPGALVRNVDDADLDALIKAGRSSADTEERKSIYKDAMEIIMDWGCELPLYQRKDCTTFSTERIDIDSIPQDMTPYWNWYAEVETLAVK